MLLEAVKGLGLSYVVITSPTRDDLPDGGAEHFYRCVSLLKREIPSIKVEVLIPDFKGDRKLLKLVLSAEPHVLAHNVETVPRLYQRVRGGAKYERSLEILRLSKEINPKVFTKSALILGFGENWEEIIEVLKDLRKVECDLITVGQYYQPSKDHHPVVKYYAEEEFKELERIAYSFGFKGVKAGAHVRSSYKAWELF